MNLLQKLLLERDELHRKTLRLQSFIEVDPEYNRLPFEECNRLVKQLGFMESYRSILNERIEFAKSREPKEEGE